MTVNKFLSYLKSIEKSYLSLTLGDNLEIMTIRVRLKTQFNLIQVFSHIRISTIYVGKGATLIGEGQKQLQFITPL